MCCCFDALCLQLCFCNFVTSALAILVSEDFASANLALANLALANVAVANVALADVMFDTVALPNSVFAIQLQQIRL